jgi:type II secretory pathway pseudopilin PulG
MLVVLIIVGIVAAVAIPNLVNSIEQTKAQAAKNNLLAIAAAESKYYEDYGYYCGNQAPNAACGANPISSLSLSAISSDPFNYSCTSVLPPAASFTCQANDATVTLKVTSICSPGPCGVVKCTAGGASCPS